MNRMLKSILTQVTPPVVLNGIKALTSSRRKPGVLEQAHGQKGSEWYDETFEASDYWRCHYAESEYYFLWTVIVDRILRQPGASVLEVGCGSGQLACLLRDKGVVAYHGFDFSPKRVEQAKRSCPEFEFSVQDAFQTDLFATCNYDTIVCTEFLEHVEGDTEILGKLKRGTRVYGTVPNFPFTSHVRHFKDEREVLARYEPCFSELRVDRFVADSKGKTFYLLEGTVA